MNDMVVILKEIQDTIDSKINTITDRQQQITLQKLKHTTTHMYEAMKAMAPYGDRLKNALNG